MDNLYTPITKKEALKALVAKFGAAETLRYYIADALSDLQTMEAGLADDRVCYAVKAVESLRQNLDAARILLDNKDNKPSIEGEVKKNLLYPED